MAKRNSNEQPLGNVIKGLMKVYGMDRQMDELDIRAAWEEVMGEAICKKTRSIRVRNRELIIYLDSGVLKEEFSHAKQRLVEMLNEKLGRDVIDNVKIY